MNQMAIQSAVLRMALALYLCDPTHGLTPAQEAWLRARLADRTWIPTPAERARLREPLLAYAAVYWPGSTEVLAQHGI